MPLVKKKDKCPFKKEVEIMILPLLNTLDDHGFLTINVMQAYSIALECLQIKPVKRSKAGKDRIIISNKCWQFGNEYWKEYNAFNNDPVIGRIKVSSHKDSLLCLVSHELSHHVQYRYLPHMEKYKGQWRKPHGEGFKAIYRCLRQYYVNPKIKEGYSYQDLCTNRKPEEIV